MMAPPADEPRLARRQWLAKLLGSVVAVGNPGPARVGYWLVQEAEAGIVATERPHRDRWSRSRRFASSPSAAVATNRPRRDTVHVGALEWRHGGDQETAHFLGPGAPHIETRFMSAVQPAGGVRNRSQLSGASWPCWRRQRCTLTSMN